MKSDTASVLQSDTHRLQKDDERAVRIVHNIFFYDYK